MITLPTLGVIVLAVAVGSSLQRLSGMGVGLVVAPTLSIVLGPVLGVSLTNATTVVSTTLIGLTLRRDIDWRRVSIIVPVAVLGAIPGAFLVRDVPSAWLNIIVGSAVCLALLTTWIVARLRHLPHVRHRGATAVAGVMGAFLNTVAGVAAPAMVIYATLSRWDQRSFAASLQVVFGTMSVFSLLAKVIVGATPISDVPPWWVLAVVAGTVLITVPLVGRIAHRVNPGTARVIAIVLAGTGAVVTVIRGIGQLF